MTDKDFDKDPLNITYSAKVSDLYDASGNVLPFHQQKYKPIIEYPRKRIEELIWNGSFSRFY